MFFFFVHSYFLTHFPPKLLSHLFSTLIPFYIHIYFPMCFPITASWLFPSCPQLFSSLFPRVFQTDLNH